MSARAVSTAVSRAALASYSSLPSSALQSMAMGARQVRAGVAVPSGSPFLRGEPSISLSTKAPPAPHASDPFGMFECKICGEYMGSCDLCKKGEVKFIREFNLQEVFLGKK